MRNNRGNIKHVVLLGASFSTGNLGVSALAWSSIKYLRHHFPGVTIEIVGTGVAPQEESVRVSGNQIVIKNWPVRYRINQFCANSIIRISLGIILARMLRPIRSVFARQQSTLGSICRADLICDITGGDSFSDIYGLSRYIKGYLLKRACQLTARPFVLLPQTYGPFKSKLAKVLAGRIFKKADVICARDTESAACVNTLLGPNSKVRFFPDLAFILDPESAVPKAVESMNHLKREGVLVGLNISGLLYHGGYTGKNEFGLKTDYHNIVHSLIRYFCTMPNVRMALVPHVVPVAWETENDLLACEHIYDELSSDLQQKVWVVNDKEGWNFNACTIKYIIGSCDFFLGSRMHSTIAAISQGIPTVGLAYSKKFKGVYESVGLEECVVDLRRLDLEQILLSVKELYANRDCISAKTLQGVTKLQESLLSPSGSPL
ncbi:MAG: polysaccharide pyruvyl transferase family protein [Sedimentisphaerales bacterium]|nr:polysaccharide pyruvyl transferase family protein [Sedimentisphaerales bacterium]